MRYCKSIVSYNRAFTVEVKVGDVVIGGENPVRIQSMANTDTNDTEASAQQALRIAQQGGEMVRFTAQGRTQAENLKNIKQRLSELGCYVPLIADIHFNPEAALIAARNVEKVRINPGNFVDKRADFTLVEYTDIEYAEELKRLRAKFMTLLEVCKSHNTALRIGVNHGSLSDRIMSRYGDTPSGMVESAMEFIRICRQEGFNNVVISMKSSNVRVMVQAYRLLAAAMIKENMHYPLHLGVTEAGDAEDARVKSAVGIGALLADGLGDTIRVSLTEAPENEINVARKLTSYFQNITHHKPISDVDYDLYSPFDYLKRKTNSDCNPVVVVSGSVKADFSEPQSAWLYLDIDSLTPNIASDKTIVLTTNNTNGVAEQRAFFLKLSEYGITNPVIIKRSYNEDDLETLQIKAAADFGMLFIDGFGDGIWIENCGNEITPDEISSLSFAILQATRVRISRTEYIACPGCGRTLFDLQKTLAEVKRNTSHLIGLKIAVMGCIVNGPGEMADADYGYVGAGEGKVTLYKGKEVVKRNIDECDAIEELLKLIAL